MALLTPHGVKQVFQLQKPKGLEHLRQLLSWGEFDELSDPRRSILLDALYDSIVFAGGKGFPWAEVALAVKFTEELLEQTKGCSITEAISILGSKLGNYQRRFSATHLPALCDYFHNTFIRHYKLYQYVLIQDQDINLTVTQLEVCVPPPPLPLAEGTHREVWQHQQQVAALAEAEVQKRRDVQLRKDALRVEEAHLLEKAFQRAGTQGPEGTPERPQLSQRPGSEALESLVGEAIRTQIRCLRELLQFQIQAAFDILDLRLQRKILSLNVPLPFPPSLPGQGGGEGSFKSSKGKKGRAGK
ncbi:uncharacterized protein C8orf74 homolog [Ctenodactylus gundi]